jgi:hypothetical protein
MRIWAKSLLGRSFFLDVAEATTVMELKCMIAERLTWHQPISQRLIFQGRELRNTSTLSDYGVADNSLLLIIHRGCFHGCRQTLEQIYEGVEALLTNMAGLPHDAENLALQRQILEGVTDLQRYISDLEDLEEEFDAAPYSYWNHLLRHELVDNA